MAAPKNRDPAQWSAERRLLLKRTLAALGLGSFVAFVWAEREPLAVGMNPRFLTQQNLSATATAGAGHEMIGDAVASLTPEARGRIQANVGLVTFHFTNGDSESGTAWFVQDPGQQSDRSLYLATAKHVAARNNDHAPREVARVLFARPHIDSHWIELGRDAIKVAFDASYDVYTDHSRDCAVVRILPNAIPPEIAGVRGFSTDSTPLQPGVQLVATQFPYEAVSGQKPLTDSSMVVSFAPVVETSHGTLHLKTLVDHEASGSPVFNSSLEVVGLLVSGDGADPNVAYASGVGPIPELIRQTQAG